jgi:hypothetical protein
MTREEFERIADAVLEGTADTSEQERFARHVSSDPQARETWSDLQTAHAVLAQVHLDPVPQGLHAEILRAIRNESRQHQTSWWSEILATFRARPVLAYGTTFAVGLAAGILAFGTLSGGWESGRKLAPSTVATLPAQPEAAAPVAIEVGGAKIEVTAGQVQQNAVVVIRSLQGSADVTLDWDSTRHGLAALHGSAGDAQSIEPGHAVFHFAPGTFWTVSFHPRVAGGGDVRITVRTTDGEARRTVHLPG